MRKNLNNCHRCFFSIFQKQQPNGDGSNLFSSNPFNDDPFNGDPFNNIFNDPFFIWVWKYNLDRIKISLFLSVLYSIFAIIISLTFNDNVNGDDAHLLLIGIAHCNIFFSSFITSFYVILVFSLSSFRDF